MSKIVQERHGVCESLFARREAVREKRIPICQFGISVYGSDYCSRMQFASPGFKDGLCTMNFHLNRTATSFFRALWE